MDRTGSSSSSSCMATKIPSTPLGRKYSEGSNHPSVIRNLKHFMVSAAAVAVSSSPSTSGNSVSVPVSEEGMAVHPDNPEGSIIKDLLLKTRDSNNNNNNNGQAVNGGGEGTQQQQQQQQQQVYVQQTQELSMLVYVCTICKIAFRNKENLEVHRAHYCKGSNGSNRVMMMGNCETSVAKLNSTDHVQRKISVMEATSSFLHQELTRPKGEKVTVVSQSSGPPRSTQPPIGNILKQQLLAPQVGPPLKKRKISEPVLGSRVWKMAGGRSGVIQATDRLVMVSSPSSFSPTTTSTSVVTTSKSTAITSSSVSEKEGGSCESSSPTGQGKCGMELEMMMPDYYPYLECPPIKISLMEPIAFPSLNRMLEESEGDSMEFVLRRRKEGMNGVIKGPSGKGVGPIKQVASMLIECEDDKENSDHSNATLDAVSSSPSSSLSSSCSVSGGTVASRPSSLVFSQKRKPPLPSAYNLIGSTLISPETPRAMKSVNQLYINGQAYTYLGLKLSTKSTYCCIYRPQPMYVVQETDPKLSMYSNWRVAGVRDEILRYSLASYDSSRKKRNGFVVASGLRVKGKVRMVEGPGKDGFIFTSSNYWAEKIEKERRSKLKREIEKLRSRVQESKDVQDISSDLRKISEDRSSIMSGASLESDSSCPDGIPPKRVKIFEGGFKSNEDYTYVRGRGRGKYVCEECGIRCKKPSMLKKHIRTHTDLRPYSCRNCAFAFKTKGNLTKHMKSKAHHKKCVELGILPVPTAIDESQIDSEALAKQEAIERSFGGASLGSDDEDDEEGMDEEEEEEEEEEDDEGVPIPIINTVKPSSGQAGAIVIEEEGEEEEEEEEERDDEKMKSEEEEVAQSLLVLSGSNAWSEEVKEEVKEEMGSGVNVSISGSKGRGVCLMPNNWSPAFNLGGGVSNRHRSYSMNEVEEVMGELGAEIISSEESEGEGLEERGRKYSLSGVRGECERDKVVVEEAEAEVIQPMDLSRRMAADVVVAVMDGSGVKGSGSQRAQVNHQDYMPTGQPAYVGENEEEGRSVCSLCSKLFSKPSQLRLHMNIHYFERPFKCDPCAVSFRTKGHLQKHQRSTTHSHKVNMNLAFGTPTMDNPRPFKCSDCKIAFRIHGHLAKHLRSKLHIMKLECLGKLPYGLYAEMERSGMNMNDIDTTDCENSLVSLQLIASRMYATSDLEQGFKSSSTPSSSAISPTPIVALPPAQQVQQQQIVKNIRNGEVVNYRPYSDMAGVNYGRCQQVLMPVRVQAGQLIALGGPVGKVIGSEQEQFTYLGGRGGHGVNYHLSSPPASIGANMVHESSVNRCPVSTASAGISQVAAATRTGSSSQFASTRSNTCSYCLKVFKSAKFLQVHLYSDHHHHQPNSNS